MIDDRNSTFKPSNEDIFETAIEDFFINQHMYKLCKNEELVDLTREFQTGYFSIPIKSIIKHFDATGELSRVDRKLLESCNILLSSQIVLEE